MSTDKKRSLAITYGGAAAPGQQRSMYDETFVTPMRRELTELGFAELRTADEVDDTLPNAKGTAMVVVNSICGCSARMARPAVRLAFQQEAPRPNYLFTVFAGQDAEATERARSYFTGYPPSSPSIALLRDGQLVWMLQRKDIEGRAPDSIASDIVEALRQHAR